MSIFDNVLNDPQGVQSSLLGPSYPYYKYIKSPSALGMSNKPDAIASDIKGLIGYVNVLVSGKSSKGAPVASTTGEPLGNKFFLKTGAKCNPKECPSNTSSCSVDRYIYIDNVPSGNIPFISSGMGENFSEFKGLIPGAMGNLNVLNPYSIMSAFLDGSTPDCQEITMQVIDNNNKSSTETHYVTVTDINAIDPCSFSDNVNPSTKKKCKEGFQPKKYNVSENAEIIMHKDPLFQTYLFFLSIVCLYIFYKIMLKYNSLKK